MKLITKDIDLKKAGFIEDDLGSLLGLDGITLVVNNFTQNKYTDGVYLYDIKVFTTGLIDGVRTDVDDYCVISDSYKIVAIPMMQGDCATPKAKKALDSWSNSIDFMRNEATLEDFTKLEKLLEEYELKAIDFEYLLKKGITTDKDKIKWELRPLAVDLCTGRKAYCIVAVFEVDKGKIIKTLKERKLPISTWNKVKKYMDYFTERSDNFDPMADVEFGTYYTFDNKSVSDILSSCNNLNT